MPSQHCLLGKCQREISATPKSLHHKMGCPSIPGPGRLPFPLGRASLESPIGLGSRLGKGPGCLSMLSRKEQSCWGAVAAGVYVGHICPRSRASGSELNGIKEQHGGETPSPQIWFLSSLLILFSPKNTMALSTKSQMCVAMAVVCGCLRRCSVSRLIWHKETFRT